MSWVKVPRPSNTDQRRAQIVDALLSVMSIAGYERASIAAIAKEARLAPGLIHYHFERKQEILVELVARLNAGLAERIERRLARAGESPRRRVHAVIDAFVARDEDADPRAVAAWVVVGSEALRQDEVRELYAAALEVALEQLRREIGDYLRDEKKSTRGASKIAAAVLAAIEGSYRIAAAAPALLPEGFAAPTIRRMVDGLVAAEEGS